MGPLVPRCAAVHERCAEVQVHELDFAMASLDYRLTGISISHPGLKPFSSLNTEYRVLGLLLKRCLPLPRGITKTLGLRARAMALMVKDLQSNSQLTHPSCGANIGADVNLKQPSLITWALRGSQGWG